MIAYIIFVIFCVCIISVVVCHFSICVSKYEIVNRKIPKDFNSFKIVQLSDLHNRVFGKYNKKLIDKILKEKPNIIVMTGDNINGRKHDIEYLENLIAQINTKTSYNIPIYYIMGNREFELDKEGFNYFISELTKNNVIVLDNKKDEIVIKDSSIDIFGINYVNRIAKEYYQNSVKNKNIKNNIKDIIHDINKNKFNILLAHNPDDIEEYADMDFDLVLSGHVHGGVIRIPFLGGLLSPRFKIFPTYDKGLYKCNKTIMCVSRGLGYGTIPFRLFNRPEIVVIILSEK